MARFKGWDWIEVIEWFHKSKRFPYRKPEDLKEDDDRYEDLITTHFFGWINSYTSYLQDEKKTKKIAKICREYTEKLATSDISYTVPLWKGLAKIENDEVFLRYLAILFQYMWS